MPEIFGPPNPHGAASTSSLGMSQPPPLKPDVWAKLMAMIGDMPRPLSQAPPYEPVSPTIASGTYSRSPVENPTLQDFWNRLSLSGYAGAPLHQAFLDVQGTGNNATNRYGNLDTKRGPLVGGRVEYQVNPYLSLALDGMRGSADIVGQQGRHGQLHNVPYPVDFMAVSPSLKGALTTDYGTPYAGVGPVFFSSTQGTSDKGASPPSLDIGLHAYGGYETPDILDKLRAFAEAKYLYSNQTGGDVEGQFAGPFQQMSVLGGLKYRFGEPEK